MAFGEEDAEDFSEISETGDDDEPIKKVADEEDEEFDNEFQDEGFEDESKLSAEDDY